MNFYCEKLYLWTETDTEGVGRGLIAPRPREVENLVCVLNPRTHIGNIS